MCGRAYGPRLLWMWPSAKICVMGGEQAAGVLTTVKAEQLRKAGQEVTPEMLEEIKKPILARYEAESSCYYSTARLWDDGVIEMTDTRAALALGIATSLNAPIPDYRVGIFRM